MQLCWHIDVRLLTSCTSRKRKYCVVLSGRGRADLLQQQQITTTSVAKGDSGKETGVPSWLNN